MLKTTRSTRQDLHLQNLKQNKDMLANCTPMKYSDNAPVALVEFEQFSRFAVKHLHLDELDNLKDDLSRTPEKGVIIPGTGGVRKLRLAAKGKGKSGGVRIIYYYHDKDMPLLLLTGFAKNEMKDLNEADKHAMKKILPSLISHYRKATTTCH